MVYLALISLLLASGCQEKTDKGIKVNEPPVLLAFYYPWWGNIETDGMLFHWSHRVMGENPDKRGYPGGDDIGANFYPQLGCYSSNDKQTVTKHMEQLTRAGVDLICLSWWGEDSFEDKATDLLMDVAARHGVRVCFHLEPLEGRDAVAVRAAIEYLVGKWGAHEAFYRDFRYDNRPLFFVYDSYQMPAEEWARMLAPDGDITIRGTRLDAVLFALWVDPHEEEFMVAGHFDGFYTYFVSDGFSYGSTPMNWSRLAGWADENDRLFVPCVGPGYIDTRIRPWNTTSVRSREDGAYYDRMFGAAAASNPDLVGITSFNEWHEGTQIEPAVPFEIEGFVYEDYSPLAPEFYLDRTRYWTSRIRSGETFEPVSFADDRVDHFGLGGQVSLTNVFSPTYDAFGAGGLVDGIRGSLNYRDGRWQGYEGIDLLATVDMGEVVTIGSVELGFLQSQSSWIFLPVEVLVAVSVDGESFDLVDSFGTDEAMPADSLTVRKVVARFTPTPVRYVRVQAKNVGVCPAGHPGAGGKAWLFVDEIVVR